MLAARKNQRMKLIRPSRDSFLDEDRRIKHELSSESPCGFYYRDIDVHCENDRVIVSGKLPNFALKEHLFARLASLTNRKAVDDRTVVVNSQGLSSECIDLDVD